ncbi:hypothetical protein [uncultured Sphingomonas sp.]|uniref:hypothetical protein n=1 Tax=uncultured Sphingomonas sp. TaxID=158754 RepID=UPI0025ECC144|nr:hypothetical protein [uncultured Sphingomonas sp.]
MRYLRKQPANFQIIDRVFTDRVWDGSGTTLAVDQSVGIPQTPNGTTILGWMNQATANNNGALMLTSGGSQPAPCNAPALAAQPSILVCNWHADNLNITNVSANAATPIWVGLFGPGMPGQSSKPLPTNGTPLVLATSQSGIAATLPQYMRLKMSATSASLCVFAIVGGPADGSGNNGFVIAVNAAQNTGPDTGVTPPPGYYATTVDNSFTFQFNWAGQQLYVVNMSPVTASGAQVTLNCL